MLLKEETHPTPKLDTISTEIIHLTEKEMDDVEEELKRLRTENELLKRYVEPEVLEALANGELKYLEIGGAYSDVSVMFVDIRNFTPMAEKFSPDVVVDILNRFLDSMSETIVENGGVLDKFIGDAVMCFWAKPFSKGDYVLQSVKTAVDMIEKIRPVTEALEKEYNHTVSIGIGIQCGKAVVGNIGTSHRLDFTVIGDIVNTAARLESQAKNGTSILIGHEVYEQVKNKVLCQEIESGLQLKGKTGYVRAYSVESILPY